MTGNRHAGEQPQRVPWVRQMREIALALSIAATGSVGVGGAWMPTVLAATCEIPAADFGDAGPVTDEPAQSESTPAVGAAIIQVEGEDIAAATPIAVRPAATPLAATPVLAAPDPVVLLAQELTAVSEALAACLSAGDSETVAELAGERYLGQLFGGSVPLAKDEYIAIAEQVTPVSTRIVALDTVAQPSDDRATAIVTQVVGNQLVQAEWSFEQVASAERREGESAWRLSGERQQPVTAPADAAIVDVAIGERSFTLAETTVDGPDVVLRGSNRADEDHEMLVLRLAPGYTTADLLRASGPDLPEDVTFIGAATVRAGDENELVLVDLDPGEYTIVCFFPDEQGTPHLAQGMEATFSVG